VETIPPTPPADNRTRALVDFQNDLTTENRFYDFPFPSDLRLTAAGGPDLVGVPHPSTIVFGDDWASLAMDRCAFPTVPVAYFRFTADIAAHDHQSVIAADKTSPILLIDIDPTSPDRGRLIPTVAATAEIDDAVSEKVRAKLPVNPERLPGASEQEYLNLKNVPAMRDTFRQGVIEQRLLLDAMLAIKIDPAVLAACTGPELPAGETAFHFAADKVVAQGQSMGGMYTNMVSAVEPRIRAAVPTGAGGFWTYYVLQTIRSSMRSNTNMAASSRHFSPREKPPSPPPLLSALPAPTDTKNIFLA
jgi:hypothetical protein